MSCSTISSTTAVHITSPCEVATNTANAPLSLLLPAPTQLAPDVGDAIAELLRLSSSISDEQMKLGKNQITFTDVQRRAASDERMAALEAAAEAARKAEEAAKKGGFFSFITDNIALIGLTVVAVAATVATAGGAGPGAVALVGIGISLSTEVASRTGALDAAFGKEAAGWVALGGAVVGSGLTLGASLASSAQAAAELKKAASVVDAVTTVTRAPVRSAKV